MRAEPLVWTEARTSTAASLRRAMSRATTTTAAAPSLAGQQS